VTPPGAPPLAGRVAIVTGASRGIGQATAAALAELGAEVIVTSRQREAAEKAAREIGPQATGIAAHASDETAARACVDFALERFGRLDILVNNAGTNPAAGRLVDVDRSRFNKTVEVNLWAPVLWTGLAWHAWMSEHGGCVINTASVGGLVVGPNLGVYNATKAALIHLTRQMAIELAPRVRVNAVAPGVVRTKLAAALWSEREAEVTAVTPLGRIGEPADVAAAMSFLASDAASWITGQTFVIDGGQMLVAPIGGDEPGRLP
jgi:NAD(P)-dependent dehydrogenase (short-subunit alcohol dehydrogenase family)